MKAENREGPRMDPWGTTDALRLILREIEADKVIPHFAVSITSNAAIFDFLLAVAMHTGRFSSVLHDLFAGIS